MVKNHKPSIAISLLKLFSRCCLEAVKDGRNLTVNYLKGVLIKSINTTIQE